MPHRPDPTSNPRKRSTLPRPGRARAGRPSGPGDSSLRAFLFRTDDSLTYHQLQGFLFAIASAPEMVPPSEWIPLVFGGDEPTFDTNEQAEQVVNDLMTLYNEISAEVFEDRPGLPDDCRFRKDVLSNLEDDAPVSQWSRGFLRGHSWLEKCWGDYLPDESKDEFDTLVITLSFFSSERLATSFLARPARDREFLVEAAEAFRNAFPDTLAIYASLGRSIDPVLTDPKRSPRPKIGRNEPCPCGSGRKYKKCCGAGGWGEKAAESD